ncbi:hydrogenase maturation protease [bacterium]|nr:hydrogenase maturation protease [bacterium]
MGVLVIGVGNELRRDDGVGIAIARRISAEQLPGVIVRECTGEGAGLINAWTGHDAVIVCDAIKSGSAPGTVHRLDASKREIPSGLFHYSTHEFGLAEAVELSRAMDELPGRFLIFGVEGKDFSGGKGLSKAVEQGMETVLCGVLREIGPEAGIS